MHGASKRRAKRSARKKGLPARKLDSLRLVRWRRPSSRVKGGLGRGRRGPIRLRPHQEAHAKYQDFWVSMVGVEGRLVLQGGAGQVVPDSNSPCSSTGCTRGRAALLGAARSRTSGCNTLQASFTGKGSLAFAGLSAPAHATRHLVGGGRPPAGPSSGGGDKARAHTCLLDGALMGSPEWEGRPLLELVRLGSGVGSRFIRTFDHHCRENRATIEHPAFQRRHEVLCFLLGFQL